MLTTQIPATDHHKTSGDVDAKQDLTPAFEEGSQADKALAFAVDRALWKNNVLRAMDYHEVEVHVKDGVVSLRGHIVSNTSNQRIEKAIQPVPGLLGLVNLLVPDDRLTLEVATSLASLEHSHACKFFTGISHGVVTLNGSVQDENVKFLAGQLAASHPNVRGVINLVSVAGKPAASQSKPFIQPSIGEEILFSDGVAGIVRQVIINPDDRCVTAMLLEGRFSDPRQELASLSNQNIRPPERRIVVSVELIRYLTKSSGFLSIRSSLTDHFEDFDPAGYSLPAPEWVPPFPYYRGEVLFLAGAVPMLSDVEDMTQRSSSTGNLTAEQAEQLSANDSLGG